MSLAPPAGRKILIFLSENQYFQCLWRLRPAGKSCYFYVKINIAPLVPTPHPGQLITVAVLSSGFLPGTLTATYGVSPVTV